MLPEVESYYKGSQNAIRVDMGDITLWFSYTTIIAVRIGPDTWVSKNEWSNTTGKHLAAIDGGVKANPDRIPHSELMDIVKERVETMMGEGHKVKLIIKPKSADVHPNGHPDIEFGGTGVYQVGQDQEERDEFVILRAPDYLADAAMKEHFGTTTIPNGSCLVEFQDQEMVKRVRFIIVPRCLIRAASQDSRTHFLQTKSFRDILDSDCGDWRDKVEEFLDLHVETWDDDPNKYHMNRTTVDALVASAIAADRKERIAS